MILSPHPTELCGSSVGRCTHETACNHPFVEGQKASLLSSPVTNNLVSVGRVDSNIRRCPEEPKAKSRAEGSGTSKDKDKRIGSWVSEEFLCDVIVLVCIHCLDINFAEVVAHGAALVVQGASVVRGWTNYVE